MLAIYYAQNGEYMQSRRLRASNLSNREILKRAITFEFTTISPILYINVCCV
jgi:hypothetical protein